MIVKTEPVETAPATEAEAARVGKVLAVFFGFSVRPRGVERFLEKTVSSSVYKCALTDGQSVVVKASGWVKDRASLEKACASSEALRKRGAALPRIYHSSSGAFAVEADGECFQAVEFAAGEHFSSKPEEFAAAGAALARFHAAGRVILKEFPEESEAIARAIPVQMPYEESRKLYGEELRERLLAEHECAFPEICQSFRDNISLIDRTIGLIDGSGLNSPDLAFGILHNDFHANNGLFLPDGSFSAFLDIDQVGVGPLVFDIGNTISSFVSNAVGHGREREIEKLIGLFLSSYHAVLPLEYRNYQLVVAAALRWDMMRILRSLRRHRFDNNRMSGLLPKIKARLLPRIEALPRILSFINKDWLDEELREVDIVRQGS